MGMTFRAYLHIAHPLVDAVCLAFDVHDAWRAAGAQQDEDIVQGCRLLEFGDFLARRNVVSADQRVM